MKSTALVISFIVLLSGSAPSQERATRSNEQVSFVIGHRGPVVKHPVPLSDAELAAVAKVHPHQPIFQPSFPIKPGATPVPTREGLEAGAVHLNGASERDLIVIGSGRRYAVGNLAPFWVIRENPDGPRVVLAEWTQELRLLSTKHRGMADLETLRDTGMGGSDTPFEFDGVKYVEMMERID